jgi:hypothetical protein
MKYLSLLLLVSVIGGCTTETFFTANNIQSMTSIIVELVKVIASIQ